MTEREAVIGFAAFPGIGPQRFKLLRDYFGGASKAWEADSLTLKNIGLGGKLTDQLVAFKKNFGAAAYEAELGKQEIKLVTCIDSGYPRLLAEIPDPPIAIYIKGTIPIAPVFIGIVGTRKPTPYGKDVTQKFARELTNNNCVIVSGLARGVDGIAHRTAINSSGRTVAVLGCGVDIVYPPEHRTLYMDIIASGGAIISEVPPGHTVLRGLFPARNRIISGLCKGIVVTEGAEDSGSLITARYAAEQGRDVFAVPGQITSYLSAGPAKLIKQGAKLVTNVGDVLEELGVPSINKQQIDQNLDGFSPSQRKIIDLLLTGELHFDDLVLNTGISPEELGSELTQLELDGILHHCENGCFRINQKVSYEK